MSVKYKVINKNSNCIDITKIRIAFGNSKNNIIALTLLSDACDVIYNREHVELKKRIDERIRQLDY